jgi:integrase
MRVFRPTYTDRHTRKQRKSARWYVSFKDHNGITRRWPAFKNKSHSDRLAARLDRLLECRAAHRAPGDDLRRWIETLPPDLRTRLLDADLLDRALLASDRTLAAQLDGDDGRPGFRQTLADKGNTPDHVDKTTTRIRRVFDACGFAYWADLAAPGALASIGRYLAKLRTVTPAKPANEGQDATAEAAREIGARTATYYVKALRQFGRYMVKHGGALTDHLAHLDSVDHADVDKVDWRPLSVDEMRRLIRTTAKEKVDRFGVAADERVLVYRFAFETGIRAGQLRRLTCQAFALDATPPTVTTAAGAVKRRVRHAQVLRPGMAGELRKRFAAKMPQAAAFQLPNPTNMARMVRADLAAARAAWIAEAPEGKARLERQRSDFLADVDHNGDKVVFHSLRHTHGTVLGSAGIAQQHIQASLHHTSGRTTERYLHSHVRERQTALDALPDLSGEAQAATGTDGAAGHVTDESDSACLAACLTGRSEADSDGLKNPAPGEGNGVFDGSGGARTHNQGIMSPVESSGNVEDPANQPPCLSPCLPDGADSGGPKWPEVDAEPEGGMEGALARLAAGTRRLCGGEPYKT